jgi:SAM-dependent methyltransferase
VAHSHLSELLDLDAAVLHEYHHEVISWVTGLVPDRAHIVDLGAGTGVGALALAQALPGASVVAVDASDEMLAHLRHRAHAAGVGDRVRTVQADLDQPWPDLGVADLVWMSASLHHLAEPGRALAQVLALLRPGGLYAVTELDSFPLFLADRPEAAVEERCHALMAQRRAEAGMHIGADWATLLRTAGFTVEAERRFTIVLRPPLPELAGRYAQVSLQRSREALADRLDAADLATLDAVTAELDDFTIRAERTVWLARRPGSSSTSATKPPSPVRSPRHGPGSMASTCW